LNTDKVKNVVIVLLVALNAALFGLLQIENNRFRLSAAQDTVIRELFNTNNINIDTLIPRDFRPMRGLYVLPFQHDIDVHAQRFFPNETPETEVWLNSLILRVGERSLTLEDNVLRYLNPHGYATPAFLERGFRDIEAGRALADEFIQRIMPPELNFVFDYYSVDWDAWDDDLVMFFYRGSFEGRKIQNNHIRVWVGENGIERVSCHLTIIPQGFAAHSREIFSADEALFAVLQTLVRYNDSDVRVVGMEVAYFLPNVPTDNELTKAIPCYKIVAEIDNLIEIFWVDAYTLASSKRW
jgi:hypothetical protein